jgi:hypothetical protein
MLNSTCPTSTIKKKVRTKLIAGVVLNNIIRTSCR